MDEFLSSSVWSRIDAIDDFGMPLIEDMKFSGGICTNCAEIHRHRFSRCCHKT